MCTTCVLCSSGLFEFLLDRRAPKPSQALGGMDSLEKTVKTSALVIAYIGGMKYVVLTREDRDEDRNLRKGSTDFVFFHKFTSRSCDSGTEVVW